MVQALHKMSAFSYENCIMPVRKAMGRYRDAINKLKEIEYNLLTVAETHL
jgi:hypothetical protein